MSRPSRLRIAMPYKRLGLICTSSCLPNLAIYLRSLGFEVSALWCPNQDLAISTAAELEVPFVAPRPDDVLLRKEVEMVLIASKPSLHSLICEKALGIGKHVLCVSPATLSLEEAGKMVQAAEYYPQILSLIGFGLRHLDVFQRMRKLLRENYVGEPLACEVKVHCSSLVGHSFDWFWEHEMGGGVLNLIGSQIIDLISVLLNARAERVQGLARTYSNERRLPVNGFRKLNADDFVSFLMKFPGNMSATVTLNSLWEPSTAVAEDNASLDSGVSSSLNSASECFQQEIIICGSEGRLVAKNEKLFGTQLGRKEELIFDGTFQNVSTTSERRKSNASDKPGRKKSSSSILDSLTFDPNSAISWNESGDIPRLYVKGFSQLLEILSRAIPDYSSSMERSTARWRDTFPTLGTVASFQDAQYVRAVIEAVRHSSLKGEWIRVDG